MKILALDTSTTHLTIAVLDGENTLSSYHEKVDRNHSSLLVPMIDATLVKAKLAFRDIDVIAVGVGPGSFTGLRIGITTVKGLALSSGKPIVAVPTFDAIARNVAGYEGVICPVLDARKNKVYGCFYRQGQGGIERLSDYLLVPAVELVKMSEQHGNVYFLGDGVKIIDRPENEAFDWYPRAEVIGRLAIDQIINKKFITPADLEPMYLYSKECDITGK